MKSSVGTQYKFEFTGSKPDAFLAIVNFGILPPMCAVMFILFPYGQFIKS